MATCYQTPILFKMEFQCFIFCQTLSLVYSIIITYNLQISVSFFLIYLLISSLGLYPKSNRAIMYQCTKSKRGMMFLDQFTKSKRAMILRGQITKNKRAMMFQDQFTKSNRAMMFLDQFTKSNIGLPRVTEQLYYWTSLPRVKEQ